MNDPATPSSQAPTSPAPTSPGAESVALNIAGIINLRDVGGYATTGGETVATGLLYRSGRLGFEGQAGIDALAELGLSTVFDLR
ncbi:MAG: tyrosine-protein phosphatase, partial [Actinobacteria bacterium]|nr:tyrosine-protein phosphatase [Actinomycetota bacterium]